MKKAWIGTLIVVIIIVAIAGYLGRHSIKAMLGMTPAASVQQTSEPKPTSSGSTNTAIVSSDNIYKISTDPIKGKYLTDFQGMTLYTFDKDTPSVSNCYDQCAVAWPVYTSGATAQASFPINISVITRKDNTKQFAWKGMPLYYYAKDTKPGDITGDGIGGIWHIVKP